VPKHDRAVIFGTIYECIRIQRRPPIDRLRDGAPLKALDASHLNGAINIPAAAVAVQHGFVFFELTFLRIQFHLGYFRIEEM
tara:strand:+ start:234 stop:479 length:246 start_codon:yes stop_codon:yes gene_type:complete